MEDRLADVLTALVGIADLGTLRFVEVRANASYDGDGKLIVPSEEMVSLSEFEARFAELEAAGYSWINVCYAGRLPTGLRLVTVETPAEIAGSPRTQVNLAGPSNRALERGGDASADVVLVLANE